MKVKVFTGRWHTDEFLKDAIIFVVDEKIDELKKKLIGGV